MLKLKLFVLLLGMSALLLFACSSSDNKSLKVGNAAPDFTLKTINGEDLSLSSFKGKPIVLNFWATWCEPCKEEMPHFQQAYDRYSKTNGLIVLAVNMNETADKASAFFSEYKLTFPSLIDDNQSVTVGKYGIIGLPTTYFIDSKGVIRYVKIGPLLTESELAIRLETIGVKSES